MASTAGVKGGLCVNRAGSLPAEFPLCVYRTFGCLLGKSSAELNYLPKREDVREEQPH